jgi:hypothetical protein
LLPTRGRAQEEPAKLNSAAAKPVNDATLTLALTCKNEIIGTLYFICSGDISRGHRATLAAVDLLLTST